MDLSNNLLSANSLDNLIPQLEGRGVAVLYNHRPTQPTNISPSNGATGVSLTPTLESTPFSDPDAGDTHAASQWQVTAASGDYSSPVFDSGADSSNLTAISIPLGNLIYGETYYWRVRHQDNHGAWSDWSIETSFTTSAAFWQYQTEGLYGGVVTDLGITPTGRIFASTYGAGSFTSNDNAESWTQASIGEFGGFATNSLGHIYVGGNGISRSINDGETWASVGLTDVGGVTCLAINGLDTIYAGTFSDGIFRSTDNGETWTQINSGLPVPQGFFWANDIAINSSGHLFAAIQTWEGDGGIFRSFDNGGTWTQVSNGLTGTKVVCLAINSSDDVFAGTYEHGVFCSTDGGESWVSTNLTSGWIYCLAVSDSDDIFAGIWRGGVSRSSDNGVSWLSAGPVNTAIRSLAVNSSGHIFAGTDGEGVFSSTDNGGSWIQVNSGLTNAWVRCLASNSSGDIFAGTWNNEMFRSIDDGESWTNTGLGKRVIDAVAVNSSGHVFAGSHDIFRSTDNGETWTQKTFGLTNLVQSLVINSAGHIFAGTQNGVYRSTDNGETWTQKSFGLTGTNIIALAIDSLGHIYAGTQNSLFRSTDNGETWVCIGLTDMGVGSIAFNSSGHIFTTTGSNGVYRSMDNGETWVNTGLRNHSNSCLTIDSSDRIFVGTYQGVFYSANNGFNWMKISSGFADTSVLYFTINSSGYLFAGTESGVFRSVQPLSEWEPEDLHPVTGVVLFTDTEGIEVPSYTDEEATITVWDADLNIDREQADWVTVTVTSTTQTEPEMVTLTETGINTGVFQGSIVFDSASGAGQVDRDLDVHSDDIIVVHYEDTADISGNPDVCEDVATYEAAGRSPVGDVSVFRVTYEAQESVLIGIVEGEEMVNSVDCWVATGVYDPPRVRTTAGTEVTYPSHTSWASKTTGDPIRVEVVTAVSGTTFTQSAVYTYSGEHGLPLYVGKTWSYNDDISFDPPVAPDLSRSYEVDVVSMEDVTVPAGTFNCYKIESTLVARDGTPVTPILVSTHWWSAEPEASRLVKSINHTSFDSIETMELVSYSQTPNKPSNVSPGNGSTDTSVTPTLESSAFSDPDAGDTHAASQWQITTTAGDYSSPVFVSGTDTSNLTSITIPSGTLSNNTTYYWRVRYQDDHGAWSTWATETSFTTASVTNHPPNQPSNTLPSNGTTSVSLTPSLRSSSFADTDSGDTHAASQWQITTMSGGYSSPVYDSGRDTTNLTASGIRSGILKSNTRYYWRVRHQDNRGNWSEYSTETFFTTATEPPPDKPDNDDKADEPKTDDDKEEPAFWLSTEEWTILGGALGGCVVVLTFIVLVSLKLRRHKAVKKAKGEGYR
ncbi:hypothetical protein ACFLXE_03535 [Chloroflexota bacterium]